MSLEDQECNICFEPTLSKNNSTTECGHHFCFKCIAAAMQRSNKCPCCRSELYEEIMEEPHEIEVVENFTNNIYVGCVDDIAKQLEEEGVTMVDVLSFYNNRYNSRDPKYQIWNDTWLFTIDWLEHTIPRIIREVDEQQEHRMREQYERWSMKIHDKLA